MTNNTELDMIEKFYIGDRIDSDKLLCVTIKTCGGNSLEAEEDQEKKVRCWKSGCIEKYKEVTKDKSFEEEEEVGKDWENLKTAVEEAMETKKIVLRKRKPGQKYWWDRECTREKRKVMRCYKN